MVTVLHHQLLLIKFYSGLIRQFVVFLLLAITAQASQLPKLELAFTHRTFNVS